MIPDEAVEAAKAAIWDLTGAPIPFEWQRDIIARAALKAATPRMLAEAWDQGAGAGYELALLEGPNSDYVAKTNPYRDTEMNITDEAVEAAARVLDPGLWESRPWRPIFIGDTPSERRAKERAKALTVARSMLEAAACRSSKQELIGRKQYGQVPE